MSDSMQCVEFLGDSRVKVRDVPVPKPRAGEVLVRVAISAICGSELSALRDGMWTDTDLNPGHEMAGEVIKANGVRSGFSPTDLITHRFVISEAPEAYELFASGETGKVGFCHDV